VDDDSFEKKPIAEQFLVAKLAKQGQDMTRISGDRQTTDSDYLPLSSAGSAKD
jgi:hypothetical protein